MFLEKIPLGIVYQNSDGAITGANQEAERLLGLTLEQLQGKKSTDPDWRSIREDGSPFHGEDHPAMQVIATKKAISEVIMGIHNPRMGSIRWLRVDSVPIFESDNQTLNTVMSIFSDVTKLKQTEAELSSTQEQFRATFEQAAVGIAHVGLDGSWLRANQKICDIVGYSRDELLQLTFQDITHPDDVATDVDYVEQVIAGKIETYSMEKRYICKDKSIVWVNLTVSLVRDLDGLPKYFISIIEDINSRKQIELDLVESKAQHEQTLDAINDLVLVKGDKSKILWANEAFREYYGMSNEELAGIIDAPFTEPDFTEQYVIDDAYVFENGERLNIPEEPVTRFDGVVRYFHTIKSPIFNMNGEVIKTVGVSRDITESKQTEAQMLQLTEELKQRSQELVTINQELDAFAYTVSHDLRAPLRAIIGFTRILNMQYAQDLPDKAQHYLERVSNGAKRMGTLIDDLLDFSRLGRQDIRKQDVEPNQIIEQIFEDILPAYDDRNIQTTVDDLPMCHADNGLLKVVYLNLLSNALKFTEHRELTQIHVGCLVDEQSGNPIYFVKDNGAGFDIQYVDKIFGVFQRLHGRDEFEGTGVGLATVQRIIYRHDGRIWAEAAPNEGATFYFTLST